MAAFQAAVDEEPNNVYARFNLASHLAADGDHEGAIAQLDRVNALVPGYEGGAAWFNRGKSLLALGRYAEAVASFDRVLKLPYTGRCSHAFALSAKVTALEKLGRRAEATAARAEVDPLGNREARQWLEEGNIHASARQYLDAVTAYDKSSAHDWQGRPVALLNRGLCKKALGRFSEALADLETALALLEDAAPAELTRALIFSGAQGPEQVPRLLARLVAQMADAQLHYSRAFVRARLGNLPGAGDDLRAALALAPELATEARADTDFAPLRQDETYADIWR